MSDGQKDVAAQPLVIVRRRRSNGEEGHHGGVWKIAYADFMTAMMAFFLVMWLVNAADKKTIVQVAAYFNPVRLTDKSPSTKGISDPSSAEKRKESKQSKEPEVAGEGEEPEENAEKAPEDAVREKAEKLKRGDSKSVGQSQKDEALFSDPMGVLDKLAQKVVLPPAKLVDNPGAGDALRDPFDPASSADAVQQKNQDTKAGTSKASGAEAPAPANPGGAPDASAPPAAQAKAQLDAERLAEAKALERQIRQALAGLGNAVPNAEVEVRPEGLLISMTDSEDFGMFAVGSAEPRPEMVVAVEKLGGIVKDQPGKIVVRGHTDGRAYRSGAYDNWRLSSARAQMSYHMLVRGGVDANRIVAIEGRADRDLKVPKDATAARNRRIEILIRKDEP